MSKDSSHQPEFDYSQLPKGVSSAGVEEANRLATASLAQAGKPKAPNEMVFGILEQIQVSHWTSPENIRVLGDRVTINFGDSDLGADFFKKSHQRDLETQLGEAGFTPRVEIILNPQTYVPPKKETREITPPKPYVPQKPKSPLDKLRGQLNSNFTFERFVDLPSNKEARILAERLVTELPFNGIFLCGERGSGKTHLAHAAINCYHSSGKEDAIICTPQTFLDLFDLAKSLGQDYFKAKDMLTKELIETGLLVIDSIHEVNGGKQTQDILGTVIEQRVNSRRRTLCTSVLLPEKVVFDKFHPNASSRFRGDAFRTVLMEGQIPKTEIVQYLQSYFAIRNASITEDASQRIVGVIGNHFPKEGTTPRQVNSVADVVLGYAQDFLNISAVDQRIAQEALDRRYDRESPEDKRARDIERIVGACREYYGLEGNVSLASGSRTVPLPDARATALYLLTTRLKMNPKDAATYAGLTYGTARSWQSSFARGKKPKIVAAAEEVSKKLG